MVSKPIVSYEMPVTAVADDLSQAPSPTYNPFAGSSPAIRQLASKAVPCINRNSPVLLQGEAGSGKGVLARWLHESSPRAEELFVEVHCAGLSPLRVEAKLFGYEKGAFGATRGQPGLLEIGQDGSVLLEEIGELDLALQKKLVQALKENKFQRLGGNESLPLSVRIFASSRRDLGRRVAEGRIDENLYLAFGEPLNVPSLRERAEDIPALAENILEQIAVEQELGVVRLSAAAAQALQSASWPGNIRELRDALMRAVLLSMKQHLFRKESQADLMIETSSLQLRAFETLEQMERRYIQEILMLEGGRVQSAAKKLGIPRSSLYHKLKQYGISPRENRVPQLS